MVYMDEQERSVRRKVALEIIKLGMDRIEHADSQSGTIQWWVLSSDQS